MNSGRPFALLFALGTYGALAATTVTAVGRVGEVDIGWALAEPPRVLVAWTPPTDSAAGGTSIPLLEARQTRPMESLLLGPLRVPLAVNAYTGGAADWPARLARALTGSRAAGASTVVALGGLLIALSHRFLRFHGTPAAAGGAALLLATDWSFVFFKRVLGGTEILLQAAGLLVIWSLWSRRWKGGTHGTVALALGVGLGLGAKVTFAVTLAALLGAALLTRWDRPRVGPPERVHRGWLVGLPLLCVSPLLLSAGHHLMLGDIPRILSHDTVSLQGARIGSGEHLGREAVANVARYLGNPLGWLSDAWGTIPVSAFSPLRTLTLAAATAGAALEWKRRTNSPSAALLRFLSLAVPLQIAAQFLANRDLHHLAEATVPLALLTALGADRLAATLAPPRSILRALAVGLFLAPACFAGIDQLRSTDALVRTARAHTFTADGQAAVVGMLRRNDVHKLVVTDYELYGVLEQLAPDIELLHGWGAVSRGDRSIAGLRAAASGGYYLRVSGSAPFIYDWRAPDVGRRVDALSDGTTNWAELDRVGAPAE